MKITLVEEIRIKTEIPLSSVISIFQSGLNSKFQFFPDLIMNGHIKNNKIKANINSSLGWIDIIKSTVKGSITVNKGLTKIQLKIYPNAILIGFSISWYLLLASTIIEFDYQQIIETIEFVGLNLLFGLIPYLIAKLKINKDTKKLKNWLDENLKNGA